MGDTNRNCEKLNRFPPVLLTLQSNSRSCQTTIYSNERDVYYVYEHSENSFDENHSEKHEKNYEEASRAAEARFCFTRR